MRNKIYPCAAAALFDVQSGARIMSGGFGLCGIPENLIKALAEKNINNLEIISNNIGNQGKGLAILLRQKKIKKAICSYVGGNPDLEELMLKEQITVELIPQGTFAEKIRAAGMGIRGFYTPTGYGTIVAENKPVMHFDRPCILELPLHADFAIIKAQKGDLYGNLWFKESARNFSPLMAMAAKVTIVEVEELVELGAIPPEDVHLPGIFVQRMLQGTNYENHVENLKLKDEAHVD